MTKKDESGKKSKGYRGSGNGGEGGPRAAVSSSEMRRLQADDGARKKPRKGKKKGGGKDDKKDGLGSVSSKKRKQRDDGDENADEMMEIACKSNGSLSHSDRPLVVNFSRREPKSRVDSHKKKKMGKEEENMKKAGVKISQSKKRKSSSDGEARGLSGPTSGEEEEPQEGATKAKEERRMSREKANGKGPKSCRLSLNRVRTIMRSNNSNSKVTQECYSLICKAAVHCFPMLG